MKRRTNKQTARNKKRAQRRAENFKSRGNSRYAKKVAAGQMYGPMPKIPKYGEGFRPAFER